MIPILLLVASLATFSISQDPRVPASRGGTGLIAGRVIDSLTGAPIAGAIVTLTTPAGGQRVGADPSGRFAFAGVVDGPYSIGVEKMGYITGGYGQRRPQGAIRQLRLTDGARVTDLTVRLFRYASLQGRVTDEAGEPMVGIMVMALQASFVAGHLRLLPAASSLTDDRGIYRFAGLVPGEFTVGVQSSQSTFATEIVDGYWRTPPDAGLRSALSASGAGAPPRAGDPGHRRIGSAVLINPQQSPVAPDVSPDGGLAIYTTTFHPGVATAAEAAMVTIGSGERRQDVDIVMRAVRSTRVTGTLRAPAGPAAFQGVLLTPVGSASVLGLWRFETARSLTNGAGEFTMLGVPPGQYLLRATRAPRPQREGGPGAAGLEPTLVMDEQVAVGADGAMIQGTLRAGARISGRFQFSGGGTSPSPGQLRQVPVVFEPIDGRTVVAIPPAQVDTSGSFRTYGVPSGRYFIRVGGPPAGWAVRSVTHEGRDFLETPFDVRGDDVADVLITFTDRPTELAGMVRNGRQQPDADASVLLFPVDRAAWLDFGVNPQRLRSVRVEANGTYRISNVPPGDYFAVAIDDANANHWQRPKVLELLAPMATRVRVDEGERKSLELVTTVIR